MNCSFCDIVSGKLDAALVSESKHALAFLDRNPVVAGHCLVVPKKHYENLWSIPATELTDFMQLVTKVQKLITKNLNAEGADLRQHYRPFLPETEMVKRHIHFHVIPRTLNDAIFKKSLIHHEKLRTKPTKKQLDLVAKKINDLS